MVDAENAHSPDLRAVLLRVLGIPATKCAANGGKLAQLGFSGRNWRELSDAMLRQRTLDEGRDVGFGVADGSQAVGIFNSRMKWITRWARISPASVG